MFLVATKMYGTTLKNMVAPTPIVMMKIKIGFFVRKPIKKTGNAGPNVVGYGAVGLSP